MSKRILTGVRANGDIHLGNYLGGIRPMVKQSNELANGDKLFMFVPDLHSITTPVNYSNLFATTINNIRIYLASGLNKDNEDVYLYRQSQISAHSELSWLLSCFGYFGELSRMTQFKDKSEGKANVSVGLFSYPILMAADILLYSADYIPVGDDQKQHIELTRDLAIRVNNKFDKEIFKLPKKWSKQLEFMNIDEGVRIRSLSDSTKKMSKSIDDPKGTILLKDNPLDAAKKIMRAETDNLMSIDWNWENQPGITNLLQIYSLLNDKTNEEATNDWKGGDRYGDFKKVVAGSVETFLMDFQSKMNTITDQEILDILVKGEQKAREISTPKLKEFQKAVGLIKN